ncbi:hypothetical protein KYN89_06720 [Alteriqipengyuania sp. NZ-12B]|uniref:Uncharacterized protein n=1 Tax=Alteriqipengyuania abyssalis TaxID=2860200 RepID=A0ABS7PCE5_9SPHN|nr:MULTISPECIES: hypothetical protein [Sphingomonadales]MBH1942801.1 hypothetical protein [Erythrobacter sp. YJ-T3-07]MBY8336738.1 hypothetical protein [Alteriqipengyuania abyssalis]|tara:strand:+ start:3379 stop:3528 length:150 start_codon:yes stop_codon:yes gene_type:complete
MSEPDSPPPAPPTREERLAAQLRANLRRRKAGTQATPQERDLSKDGEAR